MAAKAKAKRYTVSDVYREADRLLKEEMASMKQRPLSPGEEIKMKQLGKALSQMVLKEMKVI